LSDFSLAKVMIENRNIQDTIRKEIFIRQDTVSHLPDTALRDNKSEADSGQSIRFNGIATKESEYHDNASYSYRHSIADVNFRDSANIVFMIDRGLLQNFPFVFTAKNRDLHKESRTELNGHLFNGEVFPNPVFNKDLLLPFILLSVFIYGLIRTELVKFFKDILKLISFRGTKEYFSRDSGSLFQWQSILFNLAFFINISLFSYITGVWYNIIPAGGKQIYFCILIFATIVSAVTVRHIICVITGKISESQEIFREYLFWVYQTHRLTSLILLFISVLVLYTPANPGNILFYAGFSIVALFYLYRVARLFLIFINRHVSIFYLILYLCALEILPVGIIIKYASGSI
jgi:hypothetical protein